MKEACCKHCWRTRDNVLGIKTDHCIDEKCPNCHTTPTSTEGPVKICNCDLFARPTYHARDNNKTLAHDWRCPTHGKMHKEWNFVDGVPVEGPEPRCTCPHCPNHAVPALEVEEKSCEHGNMKGCLGCYKPEHKTWEGDTVDALVRDITSVGYMAKSEARERIEAMIAHAREEGAKTGYWKGIEVMNEEAERAVKSTRVAAQRETVEEIRKAQRNYASNRDAVAALEDVIFALAPTPEQPPKEV